METLTLDVQGIPDEKVRFLQQLAVLWKKQADKRTSARKEEIVFATHKSDLIGEFNRAAAYEDE